MGYCTYKLCPLQRFPLLKGVALIKLGLASPNMSTVLSLSSIKNVKTTEQHFKSCLWLWWQHTLCSCSDCNGMLPLQGYWCSQPGWGLISVPNSVLKEWAKKHWMSCSLLVPFYPTSKLYYYLYIYPYNFCYYNYWTNIVII